MSAAKPMGVARRMAAYGVTQVDTADLTAKLTPAQRRRWIKKARKADKAVSDGR